ncbi:anhydro-N-acetylmuramic acid kinase [Pelagibius litoralis]|uniref:Anhydro-N-acetylmuramic acid kinase n=1 Tax=Pelagibius litoralis TaxID=374515 RepID=A0A967EVP1_9PROT|nr:anhydro-N-acetylmuramic acid kinase [Pelagibius litoralis]
MALNPSTDTQPWALGLMSGTSLDGIDAALIRSDGLRQIEMGPSVSLPYDDDMRAQLRSVVGGAGAVKEVERALTLRHAAVVRELLAGAGIAPGDVQVIGFHGHTILHRPEERWTWQIGDGALLAEETGIDVVCDMRSRDVALGGEGAPLVPLYQAALAAALPRPLAVVNVGGVANVTWIGDGAEAVLAFDTGPGNALINDWVESHGGEPLDRDGALAKAGRVDLAALDALLDNPYFTRQPPKSLDRDDFSKAGVEQLSLEDGAATLTAFTAASVALAGGFFPQPVERWLITGGGRHNPVLMAALADRLQAPVDPVEAVGWQGDALEAQAFAYLALRSLAGLPLTLPGTTGVREAASGGQHHIAA